MAEVMKSAPGPSDIREGNIPGTVEATNADLASWKNNFIGDTAKYKVTWTGSRWVLNGPNGETFLYVDSKGNLTPVDIEDYVAKIIKDATSSGGLEALRKSLYTKGFLSKKEYEAKDVNSFNNAIADAGRRFSTNVVQNFVNNPILSNTKVANLTKWLGGQTGAITAEDKDATGTYITSKEEAYQQLDEFYTDLIDDVATDAEKEEYYKLLIAEQKKAKVKTVVDDKGNKVVTGEALDEMDLYRIRSTVLKKRLAGTPLEKLTAGNGRIARDVSELKEYASDYGIKLSTQEAYDKVMTGMKPGGTLTTGRLDAQKNSIKNMAKAFYPNLGELIDSGVKPKDIASQFAYYKGQLLETPDNAYSIFDEDIQTALKNESGKGVMSVNQYQTLLRTSPKTKQKWLETKGAREEAADYALEILRSFGVMA